MVEGAASAVPSLTGEAATPDNEVQSATSEPMTFDLGGGWIKKLVQRKSGSSQGGWDAYLYAPDGTKLRSNQDLIRYCQLKQLKIDMALINLQKPPGFHRTTSSKTSAASTSGRIKKVKTRTSGSSKMKTATSPTTQANSLQVPREPEKPKVVFEKAKMDYLERQFFKCTRPQFHQLHFLSQQICEPIGMVQGWFRQRLTEPVRPLRSFDLLDQMPMIPDQPVEESYTIETLQFREFHQWL